MKHTTALGILTAALMVASGCDDQGYSRAEFVAEPDAEAPCSDQNGESLCDGKDDDCDGQIDEGLGLGERCEGFGGGGCTILVKACGEGAQVVCAPDAILADGQSCQDACTQGGVCRSGQCEGAEALTCDDADDCTTDTCHPAEGCQHDTLRTPQCCSISPVPLGAADLFGRGRIEDLVVRGDIAYLAAARIGVHILDVGNPEAPRKLAHLDLPGWAHRLTLQGDWLYVGERIVGDMPTASMRVIDVSDPGTPSLVSDETADAQYLVTDVAVEGDVAYILHYGGLRTVDISDPVMAVGLASVSIDSATALAVQGERAYVLRADLPGEIQIYDVSDPAEPRLLSRLNDAPAFSQGLHIHKNRLYTSKYDRLVVYDTTGDQLRQIGSVGRQAGRAIFVEDDVLYLAGSRGFRVYDATNDTPELLATDNSTPEDTTSVVAQGDRAFVGIGQGPPLYANPTSSGFLTMEGGLRIYDTQDPASPELVGNAFSPGASRRVVVRGDLAYVADLGGGLRLFDISDPSNPIERNRLGFPDALVREAHIEGERLFLGLENGVGSRVEVFDLSTPLEPVKLGAAEVQGDMIQIEVEGGVVSATTSHIDYTHHHLTVLVADESGGLQVAYERTLGTFRGDLEMRDGLIYLADESLMVFDALDPFEPVLLGESARIFSSITLEAGPEGVLFGTGAAISNRLLVWDVSDPTLPTIIGSADFDEPAEGLVYRDGFLYVANGEAGVRVFDVSEPTEPNEVASMRTVDHAWGIDLVGNTLFIADAYGLLQTAHLTCE